MLFLYLKSRSGPHVPPLLTHPKTWQPAPVTALGWKRRRTRPAQPHPLLQRHRRLGKAHVYSVMARTGSLLAHPHYSRERLAGAESLMQILTLPRGFSLGLPGFSPFFLLPRHFHLPLLTTSLRISCSRTSRTNNSHMLTVPPVPAVAQDWAKYMYVCTNGSASLLKCWSMQLDIEKHVFQVLDFVLFFFFHFNRLEDGSLIYETLEAFSPRDP